MPHAGNRREKEIDAQSPSGHSPKVAMKRERLAIGIFLLSTSCHATAFARILAERRSFPFSTEILLCVALAYAGSAASFLLDSRRLFLPIHAAQGLFTLVAIAVLSARNLWVEVLLAIPFLAETSIYLDTRPALIGDGAFAAVILAADLPRLASLGATSAAFHLLFILVILAATAGFGILLTFYREAVVRHGRMIRDLDTAVTNLTTANKAFQNYADTIETASKENERNRITRELHDSIGYALTNLIMMMNAGKTLAKGDPARLDELFESARTQADSALQESRRILYRLRSIATPPREGLHALEHLVRSFQAATGVETAIHYGNLPWSYGDSIDAAIFRLIQEGLTNSFKHGRARKVRILMWQASGEIRIRIWDNGNGAASIKEGIGLSGMRERFAELGGRVEASNAVDGFVLDAFIPIGEGIHGEN
jgi:signal transduction histidine kinase